MQTFLHFFIQLIISELNFIQLSSLGSYFFLELADKFFVLCLYSTKNLFVLFFDDVKHTHIFFILL